MSNIITAVFGGSRTAKTRPLHQWDYGQIIRFIGITLPDVYTVHFANNGDTGTAKTQIGNASGVIIPDEYLTTGQDIHAWIFLHAGDSDGETKYSATIPVIRRPQPTEDPPTPVQQGLVDRAIAALNAGVEAAEDAADKAELYNVRVSVDEDAIRFVNGIDGDVTPEQKSAIEEAVETCTEAATQCAANVEHYPTVENGQWMVYDASDDTWVDTGIPATGPKGDKGDTGELTAQDKQHLYIIAQQADNARLLSESNARRAEEAADRAEAAASSIGPPESPYSLLTSPYLYYDPITGDRVRASVLDCLNALSVATNAGIGFTFDS